MFAIYYYYLGRKLILILVSDGGQSCAVGASIDSYLYIQLIFCKLRQLCQTKAIIVVFS